MVHGVVTWNEVFNDPEKRHLLGLFREFLAANGFELRFFMMKPPKVGIKRKEYKWLIRINLG